MKRKLLIAANWKMNTAPQGALDRGSPYFPHANVDVVAFSTFLDLQACVQAGITTGAQCGHPQPKGAFTGNVSMQMLAERGIPYVLCGHSERRRYHGETDDDVAAQTSAAIQEGLRVVACVGESSEERRRDEQNQVVARQVGVLPLDSDRLTIAYEPIWAIGKDALRAAENTEIQEMHTFIRSLLPVTRRDVTRILYGGNVNQGNAREILEQPDVDGGLVGGASLRPDDFRTIIEIAALLS